MRKVNRTALVPYSASQMYEIVNDVLAYPAFLPWCVASEILNQDDSSMLVKLSLAKGRIKQDFTTCNQLSAPHGIQMELQQGPFSKLSGAWQFVPLGDDGCRVTMNLEFDFNSRVFNMTLAKVFHVAADRMVDAFCERADKLYG
ncbi:MAG: type II toxin-antitoxin system RatA family toxin [Pseudomonadales bacterium]|nr:type II toxin-antitoxin system RatA family toxin [Pseudomonadales bacterium]